MPYTIRKQKCKQSDGTGGDYVLSYTDKKGKKHRNCHTSKNRAKGQIAAIEMEGISRMQEGTSKMKIRISELRKIIRETIKDVVLEDSMRLAEDHPTVKNLESTTFDYIKRKFPKFANMLITRYGEAALADASFAINTQGGIGGFLGEKVPVAVIGKDNEVAYWDDGVLKTSGSGTLANTIISMQ